MKTVVIGSGIVSMPVAPTLDDGSYEALLAMEAYEVVCTFRNARAAGIALVQAETSDFSSLQTDIDSFKSDFKAWLSDLPDIDDGSDPGTRALPAVTRATWTSIAQRIAGLAISGAAGGIPGILLDLAIDVGEEMLARFLAGQLYPGGDGSLAELTKIHRKAFLHDPGILNLERSVFKAETPNEGAIGGHLESITQLLYHVLYREPLVGESGQQKRIEDLINTLSLFSQWFVKASVNGADVTFSAGSISGESVG